MKTLHTLSHWCHRVASWPLTFVFLVVTVLFNVLVFPWLLQRMGMPPGYQPLDLRFGFSAEDAYSLLEVLGPNGRDQYFMAEMVFDLIYPLCYSGLLICLLSLTYGRRLHAGHKLRLINLLPLSILLADFAENIGIAALITHFPGRMDGVVWLASLFNQLKWFGFATCMLLTLTGLVWLLWPMRKR